MKSLLDFFSSLDPRNTVKRVYHLSDVVGGDEYIGVQQRLDCVPPDPDERLCHDFRGDGWRSGGVIRQRWGTMQQPQVVDHLLPLIADLHEEVRDRTRSVFSRFGTTGVVVNGAPRAGDDKDTNGRPFYLATLDEGRLRVVSPLDRLAPLGDRIETLEMLPNDKNRSNGVYPPRTQFRSGYVERLLHPGHGIRLEKRGLSEIPRHVASPGVRYVDRFGNTIIRLSREDADVVASLGDSFRLKIYGVEQEVFLVEDLNHTVPGKLNVYRNPDGDPLNLDIALGWQPNENDWHRIQNSPAWQFGFPKIGAPVSIER
ncbi:MAG: hypothetical protein AAB551_00555 [Patescibacteria group bacterium]